MKKLVGIILGMAIGVSAVGGCQSGVPLFSGQAVRSALKMPAVPGQTEPDLDDVESE